MFKQHEYFHWLYFTKKKRLVFGLTLTLFFWLFLSLAQPFGINSQGIDGFLIMTSWILPMAGIWLLALVLIDLLLGHKLRASFKTDAYGWLLKIAIVVHAIYVIRGLFCDWLCLNLFEYAQLWFACLLFFLLTYIPFMLYAKFLYVKETFTGKAEKDDEGEDFLVPDGKNSLRLPLAGIAYFKSDDNYIDLHYLDAQQQPMSKTFRSTMKELEATVTAHPQFIRVHRSYIINMNFFEAFQASTVTLSIAGEGVKIPVSRKYKERLSELVD